MANPFSRTQLLFGPAAMEKLRASRVAVFGLGGVGGYVVEALARSGVGHLTLVDNDVFSESNLNRQILATTETIGRPKTEIARQRVQTIDPATRVEVVNAFFLPENKDLFDFAAFDYVVDAIDTVSGKIQLVLCAKEAGTPIISCMGTGNKVDPSALRVADIAETSVCPLARVMRKELKRRGVEHLKVVYSTEPPLTPAPADEPLPASRRQIPGSTAFVPAAAGLLLASTVVGDLIGGWDTIRSE